MNEEDETTVNVIRKVIYLLQAGLCRPVNIDAMKDAIFILEVELNRIEKTK